MIDLRPIKTSILSAIDRLQRSVQLAVGCYVHTLNSEARLDQLSCVDSLRVCILNVSHIMTHGEPTFTSFDGNPSQEVAKIICQNPGLANLHLSLEASRTGPFYDLYFETKDKALEHMH